MRKIALERRSYLEKIRRVGKGAPCAVPTNYPPQAWPTAISAMTISFGIGQTLGPIVVGAITDAVGSLSFALNISAAMLALGAGLSAFQKRVAQK